MTRTLMPHQEKALEYALERRHPAFLLQMRLGKTLVAIRWVQRLGQLGENAQFILVAAPLTVLRTWKRELEMEDEHAILLSGLTAEKRKETLAYAFKLPTRIWVLMNYEAVRAMPEVSAMPWDFVIADESTILKNVKAKVTQTFVQGFRDVPHRAILTGAFAPEGLLDAYCQFQFLHGSFMGCFDFWEFRHRNFINSSRNAWTIRRDKVIEIKNLIHRKAFVLSRESAGIGSKKIYTERYVTPSDKQERLNREIMTDFAFQNDAGSWRETEYAIVRATWLSRVSGGFDPDGNNVSDTKAKEILELLSDELHNEQVVVWFRYNDEMRLVQKTLSEAGYKSEIINGGTPVDKREEIRLRFMGKEIQILLAQIKCAKYGLDCSVADTAIYYSNSYSCEERAQSEDRIVHPKKEKPILYIDLVSEGCFDEEIVPRLQSKTFTSAWLMSRMNSLQAEAFARHRYKKVGGLLSHMTKREVVPEWE